METNSANVGTLSNASENSYENSILIHINSITYHPVKCVEIQTLKLNLKSAQSYSEKCAVLLKYVLSFCWRSGKSCFEK